MIIPRMGRKRTLEVGQYHEFGERVRKAFENAGYGEDSYEKIGAMIGVNASAVGKIYNGHNAASFDTLVKIAKATGANVEWLATGRGPMVFSLTGGKIDISDLSPDKQEAVRTIVQEVIKTLR